MTDLERVLIMAIQQMQLAQCNASSGVIAAIHDAQYSARRLLRMVQSRQAEPNSRKVYADWSENDQLPRA